MDKKRVLFVVSGLINCGGIESFCKTIVPQIDHEKYQIDFLINSPYIGESEKMFEELGCKMFHINSTSFKARVKERKEWFRNNAANYDIVHIHTVLATAGHTAKVAKKYGAKHIIMHSHTSHNYEGTKLKNLLTKGMIKRHSDTMIGCSHTANSFMYGKTNKKAIVLYNPIDMAKFIFNSQVREQVRKQLNIEDKFVVGHVGRFAAAKNHEYLLKVFKEIKRLNKESKLLLVGDGELREAIIAKINELELKDDVILLGARNNVSDYMNAMDCLIFPSKYEGLTIVLIEAQVNGLPILASNLITEEVFVDKSNKRISISLPPTEWAEKAILLKRKIANKEDYEIFNKATVVKKLQRIYSDITRGKSGNK